MTSGEVIGSGLLAGPGAVAVPSFFATSTDSTANQQLDGGGELLTPVLAGGASQPNYNSSSGCRVPAPLQHQL